MNFKSLVYVILLQIFCVFSVAFGALDKEEVKSKIDSFIKTGLQNTGCVEQSAVTVGVVQGGSVLMTNTYGLRDREKSLTVDKDTLFGIGSTTKAMTAIITDKVLKEQGKSWDEPITNIYPNITFHDEERTKKATFRDMYSHSMCLTRDDFWWATGPETFDIDNVISKIRYLPEACGFRSTFRYNNIMFVIGAHIISTLANTTWCELIQKHVFDAIGMSKSKCFFHEAIETGNIALGYDMVDGIFVPLPTDADRIIDMVGQAGSVHSTAEDMVKYVKYLIDSKDEYKDVFWKTAITFDNHFGSTKELTNPPYPTTFSSKNYTIAWLLGTYNGEVVLNHGGDTFTTHTFITISKDNDYGIFVSDTGTGKARQAIQLITWYIQDLLMERTPWLNDTTYCTFSEPWVEQKKDTGDTEWADYVEQKTNSVAGYAGVFNNIAFGNVTVSYREESGLFFTYNRLNCTLRQHVKNETLFRCHAQVPYFISDTSANERARILRVVFSKDKDNLLTDMTEAGMHAYIRSNGDGLGTDVYLLLAASISIYFTFS